MLSLCGCGHLCVRVALLWAQVCLLFSDSESKGLQRWDTKFLKMHSLTNCSGTFMDLFFLNLDKPFYHYMY